MMMMMMTYTINCNYSIDATLYTLETFSVSGIKLQIACTNVININNVKFIL